MNQIYYYWSKNFFGKKMSFAIQKYGILNINKDNFCGFEGQKDAFWKLNDWI